MPDVAAPAAAVLAAAGSGERFGAGGPKALIEVAGRSLLDWSLAAFREAETIGVIIVAAPPGHERAVATPGIEVVAGGEHRSQSVAAALALVPADMELVAVHDAARPLVTATLIDELVHRLASRPEAAGVIAAAPLTDTIKRGVETVEATESRDRLWAAQTPQVFRAQALREALAADPKRVAAATDDAMLVEQAGGTVLIHPASPENIKITTPADLRVAEMLLSERSGA